MRSSWLLPLSLSALVAAAGGGCGGQIDAALDEGELADGLSVPKRVMVEGVWHDVEGDYLPHVVMCENNGGGPAALMAQAIAARTFMVFMTTGMRTPKIADGQEAQVYGCGRTPSVGVRDAVAATSGVFLRFDGRASTGQFVAGALRSGDTCAKGSDPTRTERFVTHNEGLAGDEVNPAPYPIANPEHPQNRGVLGQNLSNCLEKSQGYDTSGILHYFYGADIELPWDGALES